jgi:hypothetical protein
VNTSAKLPHAGRARALAEPRRQNGPAASPSLSKANHADRRSHPSPHEDPPGSIRAKHALAAQVLVRAHQSSRRAGQAGHVSNKFTTNCKFITDSAS